MAYPVDPGDRFVSFANQVGTSSKDLVDLTEGLVGDAASKYEARYYYGDNTNPIRAVIKSFNLALAAFSP